jgi:hypothetical protein
VYIDADNDGVKDASEQPLPNVTITLTGTDDFGAAVSRTATTHADGSYRFDDLNPGNYKLKQTQPAGPVNNLPIFDGKDTIGSQGGTVSANDEFTIVLAEGVNGTNNNFAETVGHKLGGRVGSDSGANGNGSGLVLPGIEVHLYAADSQDKPVGSPLQTATVGADGTFAFSGLTANRYVVQLDKPVFLQDGVGPQVIQLQNGDSLDHVLMPRGLEPQYVSYRQFLNSTPRQGIFAAVAPGNDGNAWNGFDASWTGFRSLEVTLTGDGNRLRIDATRDSGEMLFDEIPLSDPRVRVVAEQGTTRLFRLSGGSSQYNLRPIATAGGEGESGDAFHAMLADSGTATSAASTFSAPDPHQHEHPAHAHDAMDPAGEGEGASWEFVSPQLSDEVDPAATTTLIVSRVAGEWDGFSSHSGLAAGESADADDSQRVALDPAQVDDYFRQPDSATEASDDWIQALAQPSSSWDDSLFASDLDSTMVA